MTTAAPPRRKSQAGITLVELLISMVIMGVISTMMVAGWISLQDSYGFSVTSNDTNSTARDAVALASRALRDAQPPTLATPAPAIITLATPTEVDFYSAFNNAATTANGSGIGAVRLMRIYLDTSGSAAQKTLYWNTGGQSVTLARNVVNNAIADTSVTPTVSYTAVFTYGYLDANGNFRTSDTLAGADLANIVSVQIHVLVDANLNSPPAYANAQTTVSLRNAS
jgi:prepilin-type N-terminal cleavage/methylation domain-containing protein